MSLCYDNVIFSYDGREPALCDVCAEFAPGLHLLLGPNGAGKSTMLRIAAGVLDPQDGACRLDGENMACHDPHAVKKVFMLGDDLHFPLSTMAEMADRHAPFYPNFSEEALRANLDAFGLKMSTVLEDLSPGNRRKANVAYALALGTEVLLLDEPANGLDIASKEALTALLVSSADACPDRCVIISTHTVQELRNLFDTVTILRRGRVIVSHSVSEITEKLAFVNKPVCRPDALFYKEGLDGPNQIVPNVDGIETPVDFRLLYLAATELPNFRIP